VSDTAVTPGVKDAEVVEERHGLLASRRGRAVRESVLAYLFLLPAFLIIFTFGIFPLAFSAYESTLRGLNRVVGTYDGMGNYVNAIGELAYVLGFWLAILFLYLAIRGLINLLRDAREHTDNPWPVGLSGIVMGVGFALFTRFFFIFLPLLLGIADQMRAAQQQGEGPPSELFRRFLGETVALPEVSGPFFLALVVLLAGAVLAFVVVRARPYNARSGSDFGGFFQVTVLLLAALFLAWFTWVAVQDAYAAALEDGEELALWSQIVTISAGIVLLALSWFVWRSANGRPTNLSMIWRLGAAALLMIGAWLLIGEVPRAAASGDADWWYGLLVTVYYSAGSIPFQFGISLMLATFLFQNIKGKGFFRMIYFLPYITPTVGAAAVFRVIFSGRESAPMNSLLDLFGIEPLGWLNEPTGIFQLMAGSSVDLPTWAAGPSLSMVVIIIFGVWSYVGFNTVIFLAGLGAIPNTLYEAASIDGAGRWAQFRHVTLPLLSPTIYFLTLYAVIGTFKAFNHIYVLRSPAALGTADTVSVVIFDAMKRDTRYGYAAALAMLLLIIVMGLTVVNNRLASKRVFYG
jgi:ABC-type sugar transport system permease subunit